MFSMSLKAAVWGLLATTHLGSAQNTPCDVSSVDGYEFEVLPDDSIEIRWTMDNDTQTIAIQVVAAAAAWVGVGFPATDLDMVGADAVIGLPDASSVLEYSMTTQAIAGVVEFDEQSITDPLLVQSNTSTTITFTRPLTPGGTKQNISSDPLDDTKFIYAWGTDNTFFYHGDTSRGGVKVDLYCGTGGNVASGNTMAPTATPTTEAPVAGSRGIGDITPTPAPTPSTTAAPTTVEEGLAASGASRIGGGRGWAAAATGVVMMLAVLSL